MILLKEPRYYSMEKIKQVIDQVKTQEKTIAQLKQKITNASKNELLDQIEVIDGTKVLSTSIDNIEIPDTMNIIVMQNIILPKVL